MAEERAVENGRISNFEGLVTLTLDRVILHTIVHHSSTSTYLPNFTEIKDTFCGRTYVRTDGHLRPALLGRLCQRDDLKFRQDQMKWLWGVAPTGFSTVGAIVPITLAPCRLQTPWPHPFRTNDICYQDVWDWRDVCCGSSIARRASAPIWNASGGWCACKRLKSQHFSVRSTCASWTPECRVSTTYRRDVDSGERPSRACGSPAPSGECCWWVPLSRGRITLAIRRTRRPSWQSPVFATMLQSNI